jgi:hypothetical protein
MHGRTQRHQKPFSAVHGWCDVAHFGEFWGHTASRRAEGLPMFARTDVMRALYRRASSFQGRGSSVAALITPIATKATTHMGQTGDRSLRRIGE